MEQKGSKEEWLDELDQHLESLKLPTRCKDFQTEVLDAGFDMGLSPDSFLKDLPKIQKKLHSKQISSIDSRDRNPGSPAHSGYSLWMDGSDANGHVRKKTADQTARCPICKMNDLIDLENKEVDFTKKIFDLLAITTVVIPVILGVGYGVLLSTLASSVQQGEASNAVGGIVLFVCVCVLCLFMALFKLGDRPLRVRSVTRKCKSCGFSWQLS